MTDTDIPAVKPVLTSASFLASLTSADRALARAETDSAPELFGSILTRIALEYADLRGRVIDPHQTLSFDLTAANAAGLVATFLSVGRLDRSDLTDSDLRGLSATSMVQTMAGNAKLAGARLSGADLSGARFANADLTGADLSNANAAGANFQGTDLRGAYLCGTVLRGAYLARARINHETRIGNPLSILSANWGDLSGDLTRDLMLLDAEWHPDPRAFDQFYLSGECPFDYRAKIDRAVNFDECSSNWPEDAGKEGRRAPRGIELVARLLVERCQVTDANGVEVTDPAVLLRWWFHSTYRYRVELSREVTVTRTERATVYVEATDEDDASVTARDEARHGYPDWEPDEDEGASEDADSAEVVEVEQVEDDS